MRYATVCSGAEAFGPAWHELGYEPVFHAEAMTGYLNASVANPVSRLTVGAMEDLGYTVNYSAAEPYSDTFKAPRHRAAAAQLINLGDDVPNRTIFIVDPDRRITGTARSRP